ncbi:hypothetical protein WCX72_09770 [Sulfurimonas sp. HSL1-6]|uniref:hypothetical protein n=1 Tax=Thiomicrolovo immobilis TaxID=3131935 RepID=UPI0031F9B3CC
MRLSKLIELYGDEDVTFQNLDSCMIEAKKRKYDYSYTFGTDVPFDHKGSKKMCLVVWMDREKVSDILKAAKKPDNIGVEDDRDG